MEKILHDTSSLIDEYRSGVRELKDYTTILNIIEFPKAMEISGLNIIYPTHADYKLAIEIAKELLKAGNPVPAIDIIIAAIAINNDLILKTSNRHFRNISLVKPNLKVKVKT